MTKYSIVNIVLQECEFTGPPVNFIDEVEERDPVSVNIRINSQIQKDRIKTEVTVIVLEEPLEVKENFPYLIKVTMVGLFVKDNQDEASEMDKFYANVNAAATIYPFIREMVANITTRAGLSKPLLLEPVNFVDLYNQQVKKPEENEE